MTKGEKLIWELFLMVRDLQAKVGVTAEDTKRHTEWAAHFHEMSPTAAETEPEATPAAEEAEAPAEEGDEPHPRGRRARR